MKVVLSHPFSGALYWWLAAQSNAAGDQQSKRPAHPYYRTLYGDVDQNLDLALACSVVFEEVVLPAADAPYPGFVRSPDHGLRLPELEMATDWDTVTEARRLLEPSMDDLLRDTVIRSILRKLPDDAQRMALLYATTDVLLTQLHSAPVMCAPGRRKVVLRLIDLGIAPVQQDLATAISNSGGMLAALEAYADVVSLRFTSDSIQSLSEVKWNDRIRRYAESFQAALVEGKSGTPSRLFEDLAAAWDSAELTGKIGGAFSATSRMMGPLGLVPGVGTVTGILGMGADAAAEASERRSGRMRWYELGPEILRFESLRDLERELKRRGFRA